MLQIAAVRVMLVRKFICLFHQIDSSASRICRNFSVYAQKCHGSRLSHLQFSLEPRYCKPYHHVRWLACDSSDSCSSSDDKLCVYQPDVRRIRIVTMNDVYTDDIVQDAASAQTSVQRDTIYTRRHVSADDPTVQELFRGICEGSRSALARAITLIESIHPMRRAEAQVLLREILEHSRKKRRHSLHRVNSFRIGSNMHYMMMMVVINIVINVVIAILFVMAVVCSCALSMQGSDLSQGCWLHC